MQRPEITQSAEARATRANATVAPPTLAIGVLLQSSFAARVAGALAGVASLRDLVDIRPDESLDLLVVDPRLLPKHPRAAAASRRFVQAQIPLVYYTSLSRDAMLAATDDHDLVSARLVMHGEDDAPATLRELVEIAPRLRHVRLLRRHLDELLEPLSPPVRASMEAVVSAPERFYDASDVATRAGVSRRHADRSLAAAGLAPTKRWVIGARAWHAARLLACPGCSVEAVAARLGYRDSKTLRRHLRAVWGITPSALAGADLSALLAQLIAFLGG
ncbi:MAG TPA: helix-turn-helix domain-containing protein [Gemmatimonadaceae bacterium]|jgi:AraC-like DNA-binding protein|nr:helix-turn-helix domain-containing protein [Gemmatimonadaceae bacterium]